MSVSNENKDKKKWTLEDWLFHLLLLFAIVLVPIASVILVLNLPDVK